jgi:hypothetical protein
VTSHPLPTRSVHELITLVRSLYFAWSEDGAPADRLDALVEIGRDLRGALELAERTLPGSSGHRAAWTRAETATARLCEMIDGPERNAALFARAVGEGARTLE